MEKIIDFSKYYWLRKKLNEKLKEFIQNNLKAHDSKDNPSISEHIVKKKIVYTYNICFK